MLISLFVSAGCMSTNETITIESAEEEESASPPVEEDKNLGGWRIISTEEAEVRSVFNWVREQFSEDSPGVILEQPKKVERQVVAGYKYRLHCRYCNRDDPEVQGEMLIVVWKHPDGLMEFLSMEEK